MSVHWLRQRSPRSNDSFDFAITREMTSFSTTFSVMVIACKIGTELANNELNVRVIVAKTDFFMMSPNIGSLKRKVSSKSLPSLLRLHHPNSAHDNHCE